MVDFTKLFPIQEQAESGGNPLAVSKAGAIGPMQTMPGTLTSPGYGVAAAKDNSIEEQRRVGQDYMKAMVSEYGDLPTALAAYNWGPGNVNKWKATGADPAKLPKETQDYIAKITKQLGESPMPAGAGRGNVAPPMAAEVIRMPQRSFKDEYEKLTRGILNAQVVKPTSAFEEQMSRDRMNENAAMSAELTPTTLEMVGAAMSGNTGNSILRAIMRPRFEEEAGYKPDLSMLPDNADRPLLDDFFAAKSSGEAKYAIDKFNEEQMRNRTVMSRGTPAGIALMFGGEILDPVNWAVPFAATKGLARLGAGSEALMAAGKVGSGYQAAVVENLVSGTALEAAKQSLEGDFKPVDLGISLLADTLIGVGSGYLSASNAAANTTAKAGATAMAREVDLAKRAEQRLGSSATPEEIRKEMEVVRKDDANAVITGALADIPPEGKLDYSLSERTRFTNPDNAQSEQVISAGNDRWTELRNMGMKLSDTTDRTVREAEIAAIDATPGIHLPTETPRLRVIATALESLRKQLIPDVAIHLTDGKNQLGAGELGVHALVKPNVSAISVRPDQNIMVAVHEFSHAVMAHQLSKASPEVQAAMRSAFDDWQALYMTPGKAQEAALKRSPIGGNQMKQDSWTAAAGKGSVVEALADMWRKAFDKPADADKYARYFGNFDEYSAEQIVKYVEAQVAGEGGKLSIPSQIILAFSKLLRDAAAIFGFAKKKQWVKPDAVFVDFIDDIILGNQTKGLPQLKVDAPASSLQAMAVPAQPAGVVNELMQDPDYVRFGLTALPVGTAAERKEAQAILALYKKADAWEQANPMDDAWKARMKNLADNEVFNVASTGLKMLSSPSPLVRMLANELLEDASGVAGKRRATASIKKYMTERLMLGNALNDVQGAYSYWKKGKPGGFMDDMVGGKNWDAFNKEIASEIEARGRTGGPVSQDPNIKAAADSLEAAYQRIANEQRRVNTLGSEGLPESSVGYMPHRMSPKALIQLSNAKQQVVHSVLVDQFVSKGWDRSFADQLATKYLALARKRAAGDYGTAMSRSSAASHVEEALRGMDLPEDTIAKHMEKFNKGGASYTKGRLELDLNQIHMVDGEEFKLLDIYETNQLELLRAQAGRASGEVALTQFGVRGKPSADMIRRAMQYGEDGKRADLTRDFESYDQMMSEFYNEPYGTKTGRWMERAMNANAVVRLGGIAFNQLAETINGVAHVGVLRSLESIGDLRRLRNEILTLSKGGTVDNSIIGSIEHAGGAEFGTDAYKIVMPFDSPDHAFPTYGQDTLTAADRLLRGAGHVQSMLSGWRAIHSAQQRGMAEQIVHKMMRYIREGKDDIALEQFGIHADIRTALRNELNQIATFNGDRLTQFDVTKISDPDIREQVIQAVWRGTSQIIQGTFIGERGKWAHDGMMKLMTQFRTFSITSMEKQWGRQRNSHGTAAAFGLLMGAMTFAAPIYMARTYLSSVGRPDQEAYLEEKLAPQMIARSTLNYVASAGMAGDFMDLTTAMLPESMGLKPTGGRAGVETAFVGNYIAPASSLVDDIWKYAQSPLEIDEALKLMPGSRMPFMLPLVNLSRD